MIKLYNGGAYLLNGTELIEDTKELEAKLINGLLMAFLFAFFAHVILIALGMIFCGKRRGEDAGVETEAAAE